MECDEYYHENNHMCFSGINRFKCRRVLVPLGPKPYTSEEGGGSAAFNELSVSPASICKALSFEGEQSN